MASKRKYWMPKTHYLVEAEIYKEGEISLCPAHAKKLGVYPADKELLRRKRISETVRKKALEKKNEAPKFNPNKKEVDSEEEGSVEDYLSPPAEGSSAEMSGLTEEVAKKIVEGVFGDSEFNLNDFLDELSRDGIDYKLDSVLVDCVVIWWMAEATTRTPTSIVGVSKCLGITVAKVNKIINSNVFRNKLNLMRYQRYNRIMPVLEKRLMIKAMMGDASAEGWIKSIYKKMELDQSEYNPLTGVSDEIIQKLNSGIDEIELDDESVAAKTYQELVNE